MHIEISYSGAERSEALDQLVRESVTRDLGRFEPRLTRIEAHLSDNNAAKRGPGDKSCTIEARPGGMEPIVVKHEGSDLYEVAREASRKLGRAVTTRFEKLDGAQRGIGG